jgi:LysR family transcriptional regulator, glycine cleavage system transcriptional activator
MNRSDNRFPSIDSLRAFEAISRLGTYEKVAQELAITTSAVSKRIASLESLLGVALFDRSARTLSLSAAGKEYVEQVRSILAQLASIALHRRAAQSQPRLRVLTPPTFAREILVPQLKRFTDRRGDCEIEVVVAIPYLDMAVPEADVSVSFGPRFVATTKAAGARSSLHSRAAAMPLLFEPIFAVASPSIVKRHRIKQPNDVLRAPLIRCPIEPWRPWFDAVGIGALEPSAGVKLVDLGLSLEAAASGQGVCLARSSIAKRWLERGEVIDVFPTERAMPHSGYSLTVNRADDLALDFAKWLREHCASLERDSTKR